MAIQYRHDACIARQRCQQPFDGTRTAVDDTGRAAAVAEIYGTRLSGLIAWLIWVFVHIMYLIGFKNRIVVMIQWAWAYIGYRRGIRLITGEPEMHLMKPRTVA